MDQGSPDKLGRAPSRRHILKGALAGAAFAAPSLNFGRFELFAQQGRAYSTATVDLMQEAVVIDMLGPLSLDFSADAWSDALTEREADDFRASGISVFHNAYGIGGPDAYQLTLRYFAAWNGYVGRNSNLFTLVDKAGDIAAAKSAGKIAVVLGVQNSEHFRTPDDVAAFWEIGQRCSQLTYNSQTRIGAGGTERIDGGLSDFGLAIVAKMNEVGMLVDVSHCGDRTTLDAIEHSKGPIAITHSNCRALNTHPRLKTDEAIRKLAAKGGVMGVTGVRNFVRDKEPTTIEHMVDHIDHVAKLTSIDHVGVGSDADLYGYDDMDPATNKQLRGGYKSSYAFRDKIDTDGFDHPKKFFDLTEALLRRGYTREHTLAVLGGNFQRLLGEVWSANAAFKAAQRKAAEEAKARAKG